MIRSDMSKDETHIAQDIFFNWQKKNQNQKSSPAVFKRELDAAFGPIFFAAKSWK